MARELVNCGNCPRCWVGSKVHGSYPYRYERDADGTRHHRYGAGSKTGATGSGATAEEPSDAVEKKRLKEAAEKEADEMISRLTAEQRKKLDEVTKLQSDLKRLRRRQQRAVKKRTGEGMTALALRQLKEEVEQQFAHEKRELQKQIKDSKAELRKMLKDGE